MATSGRPIDVLKPSAEKTNYIRLARLLMCGGTTIVREVFNSIIPPSKLSAKLNEPAVFTRLYQMKKNKLLFSSQWKVLFPSPITCGTSESFDITLLFKLLREFCGLPAPPKGWDDLPDDKDISLSDDLARIKYYRNELCHVKDLGINNGDFNTYGKRIKDAFLRMVQTLPSLGPSKDWEDEIDKILTGPVTEDDERNIEELESWYLHDIEIKDMLSKIIQQLESMQPPSKKESNFGDLRPPSSNTDVESVNSPLMVDNTTASGKELEICFGDKSIATIDSNKAASKVAYLLNLDKLSLDDPPDEIVVKCRELCLILKSEDRGDIVEKMREVLPSGMTGPLGDGRLLVKDMDYDNKRRLSRAISAKEEWKAFAQNLGLTADDITFYDERERNPLLAILNDHCKNMTVDELYDRMVEIGANAIADHYCIGDLKISKGERGLPPYGTLFDVQNVNVVVEGSSYDLPSFGVVLEIPPNAVTRPTDIICVNLSPSQRYPVTEKDETLVSYCVSFHSKSLLRLQKPMVVTLLHSGPSKKEGYETIVKASKEPMTRCSWKQMKEIKRNAPGSIEVEILELTALAVVTRPITDNFEVTPKGCLVRSSVCDDVTVEFPEGAVDKRYMGSMKVLLMPDYIEILDGIDAYPCPMLLIDGLEGVNFNIPVKIRLPHPYPAGYPTDNVRVLTMDAPHEWKDITDEVHCVENKSIIEVEVNHFSWFWVWSARARKVRSRLVYLSKHLFKAPQYVCFAVFKENELCSNISLTMTLVCVPNHKQFEKSAAMKEEGYTKLASSTGNKKMRPDDKAYTKVEGCYQKKSKEDIFLHFIQKGICRKELTLTRKTNFKGSGELVISLLEKKDGNTDNLCTFCIDETKIVPKVNEKKTLHEVPKAETVGLESAPPGPSGLCSSETVDRPSRRTSASEAASGKELQVCFGDKSIAAIDSNEAASKVANYLKLDKLSSDDPPGDIMVKCRQLCSYLKSKDRGDIVEKIREVLPSGMTGPLGEGSLLVEEMDYNSKKRISRELSAKEEWKAFAQNVGVSSGDIAFYDEREKNPVLAILNDHCKNMTVDELYFHIVKSGANAIADRHL